MTRARICNSSNFLFAETKKLMSFKCSLLEQSKLHICDNLFCFLLKGCNQTTYKVTTKELKYILQTGLFFNFIFTNNLLTLNHENSNIKFLKGIYFKTKISFVLKSQEN